MDSIRGVKAPDESFLKERRLDTWLTGQRVMEGISP